MYVFNILDAQTARARIDAPMRLARRTFSDARIALSSTSTSSLFTPARFLVARSRSSPLACSHFYTNPRSFIRRFSLSLFPAVFLLSPSVPISLHFSLSLSFFARLQYPSHPFREISPFLAYSLRDPLKSFSLCLHFAQFIFPHNTILLARLWRALISF